MRLPGPNKERRVVGCVCYGANVLTKHSLNKRSPTISTLELDQVGYLLFCYIERGDRLNK